MNDQIKVINEQINEFEKYKQNHNINNNKILSRIYSIYYIVNTLNFYLSNSKYNNNISNMNTIENK